MLDSESLVRLYNNVLDADMYQYNISCDAIRIGIESMKEVYKPRTNNESADRSIVADFNDIAHRCAYLHKYAALHTAMVRDILHEAVYQNFSFFRHLVFSEECFKICSLGGGPGSDIIGVMIALHSAFSYFQTSVSVIDYMADWSYSFRSILNELGSGLFGAFGNNIGHLLQWQYVGANLLKPLTPEVELQISLASLVTMIKFVSAASCKDTELMVKNIFTAMKPGAILLFIDNDGGGFREIIMRVAQKYKFVSIFGPFQHENYVNEIVKTRRFGVVSCHKTTVSIHILQKPPEIQPNMTVSKIYNFNNESPLRRVLLHSPFRNTGDSLLGSPFANAATPLRQRFFSNFNHCSYSPVQNTTLTPHVFQLNSDHANTPTRRVIPSPQIPDYPSPPIFSFHPDSPLALNITRTPMRKGCIPLTTKFKRWHNNISKKFNKIKSRACTAIQEKYKKNGKGKPRRVFRL